MLTSCSSTWMQNQIGMSEEVTAESYAAHRDTMGVVLMDVSWAQIQQCASYQHAQLLSFGFDRVSGPTRRAWGRHITIGTTNQLMGKPGFVSVALLVPPGGYELSTYKIGVAESISESRELTVRPDELMRNGRSYAGGFSIAAGETLYVGNFGLICMENAPLLWRFKSGLARNLTEYKAYYNVLYPFLDMEAVQYRYHLFGDIACPITMSGRMACSDQ